ncbi:Uncharacterised protein [uncultured archaeon]|nr:Uncharacterised protein [uncultured archaeon]
MRELLRTIREQSAMEILVSYGWAILAIAVAAYVLFSLNIFGGSTYYVPFGCLGTPAFICGNPIMSSGGALTVNFKYAGPQMITITGLICNVTNNPGNEINSTETTQIPVRSQSSLDLTFQCPISGQAKIGSAIPVMLWVYYTLTPGGQVYVQAYAKGIVKVTYPSLQWSVTEWTQNDLNTALLPMETSRQTPKGPRTRKSWAAGFGVLL